MKQVTFRQGHLMAGIFHIQHYRTSESLHLRLTGIFDREAALWLVEELNKNRLGTAKIFVHTGPLDQVINSGAEFFRSSVASLERSGAQIIFTGDSGRKIAGEAPGVLFMK